MKTNFEIKSIFGAVLFSFEADTLKEVVIEAVKQGVNLSDANLSDANLYGANLIYANLIYVNLSDANLSYANLRGANLRYANLSGANLRGANLSYANLRGANLRGANLRGANIAEATLPEGFVVARLDFGGWSVLVTKENTSIGCQTHTNGEWLKWEPKDVASFAEGASDWWIKHGEAVKAVIRDVIS